MEWSIRLTPQDCYEFGRLTTYEKNRFFRKNPLLFTGILVGLFLLALLFSLRCMPAGPQTVLDWVLITVLGLGLFASLLLIAVLLFARARFGRLARQQKDDTRITLGEEGISSRAEDGRQNLFFRWDAIRRLLVTPHLYIFATDSNFGIVLPKRYIQGQDEAFRQFVGTHIPGLEIKELM